MNFTKVAALYAYGLLMTMSGLSLITTISSIESGAWSADIVITAVLGTIATLGYYAVLLIIWSDHDFSK